MNRNTKPMNEYNVNRGNTTRERVIAAIEQCKAEKDISTTRVCELADVHRSYFTKHPEMRRLLDTAKGIVNKKIKKRQQNENSKDVIIKSLQIKIAALEKENHTLSDCTKYKTMYESKCDEVEKLKNQLNQKYIESGILNF